MIDTENFKVVFFHDKKVFECDDGNFTNRLCRATRYDLYFDDESLMNLFNKDVQKEIEIWKVKVSVETE